jgi:hypothetical protein
MTPEIAVKPRQFKDTTLHIARGSWMFLSRRRGAAASFSSAGDFTLDRSGNLSLI